MCIYVKELKCCKGGRKKKGRNSTCHRLSKTSPQSWCLDKGKEQTEQRGTLSFFSFKATGELIALNRQKQTGDNLKNLIYCSVFPILRVLTEAVISYISAELW